ncbi:MAG: hypothetical protein L6M37_04105 [Candidatus Methylarchaceae archaeon HK02M1]|nr:hypothetical protein [Candidatus Methylarchaceae archaeon HK01M]MCP8312120.1 hypothetical protein [Candidatus Methylarchaceae archaeon HK02M1]
MTTSKVERPLGVAILAVLGIILSILVIIGSVMLIVSVPFLADFIEAAIAQYGMIPIVDIGWILAFLAIIGAVSLVIGVIWFILGWGLWNGKNWARIIVIVFSILGIIGGLLPLVYLDVSGLVVVVIDIIVIYYLTRPHVVAFFKPLV